MMATRESKAAAEERTECAYALAGMLRVAATLEHDEPTAFGLKELAESGILEGLPEGFDEPCLVRGFGLLRESFASGETQGEGVAALQREWLRLFAGVGEPLVPSWSNYYLDSESRVLGAETLALRALYAKYGLRVEQQGSEPDDDLGLMLRFLARLVEVDAKDDARELLAKHVLPWLPRWHYLGRKYAGSAFYRGAVDFVFGSIVACASHLGFSYDENSQSFSFRKDTK